MTNLWELHSAVAARNPDAPAVCDQQGATLTHAELSTAAAQAGCGLAMLGVGPGDMVAAFLPNRVQWTVLALAAAHQGIGIVGLNTRFREAELDHLTEVAQIATALVPDRFLGVDGVELWRRLQRPMRLIVDGDGGDVDWTDVANGTATASIGAEEHPLIGFTTSGTTGFPKIAMHTGGQTVAHMEAVVETFEFGPETVALVPLPLCGAFGYAIAMSVLCAGGKVVLHETWEPEAAVDAMITHGVTFFAGGDLMLIDTANVSHFPSVTTWKSGTFGDFANAAREAVDLTAARSDGRVRLSGVYGSSEGFALMSQWALDSPIDQRSRAGGYLVGQAMSVRCCDPDTGAVLAHGEHGEIHFRGPNLVTEYLNNPEATAKAFAPDGWYKSGDLGYTVEPHPDGREGFVFLARLGDSLRLRGFLCDPAEIEHHLESHPAVALAQVVGAHREGEGDVAVAFVQLTVDADSETASAGASELAEHCRSGLANYKRPTHIELVTEFPVTEGPNGVKIRKVDLRERAADLIANI